MDTLRTTEKVYSQVDNLMWKIIKLLTRKKKVILDEFELTCSQYDILSAICEFSSNKEEIIQINLAEKALLDPMTTSTILRNLEKRKLIKRERGLINTRTINVELTDSGKRIYHLAKQKVDQMQSDIYQNTNNQMLISLLTELSGKLIKY